MSDPNAERSRLLQAGISAVRARRLAEGRTLLQQVIASDPNNETAWLWFAAAVETIPERRAALNRVLQINPNNQSARNALDRLQRDSPPSTPAAPTSTPSELAPPAESRRLSAVDTPIPPAVLPPDSLPDRSGLTEADLRFLGTPVAPPPSPVVYNEPATPRRVPLGLIVLAIGALVVVIAIVVIFFRSPATPTVLATAANGSGIAALATQPTISFVAAQQTLDAETLSPVAPGATVITPVSQLLRPTWTLPPSLTPIPSATFPTDTPLPTFPSNTPLPTFASPTQPPSETAYSSPTGTTTPPPATSLTVIFAQQSSTHPADRSFVQSPVDGTPSPITGDANNFSDPSWSPDGKQLAYVALTDGIPQIALISGGRAQTITSLSGIYLGAPHWSPDGTQIAFAASVPGAPSGTTGVYVLQLSDKSTRLLTGAQIQTAPIIRDPSWSPDGSLIVYAASQNRSSPFQLQIVTVNNGASRALTDTSLNAVEPAWSPDGTEIAFTAVSSDTDKSTLMLIAPDGSAPQAITPDRLDANHHNPAWSPDGHWLAFSSDRDGGSAVYVGLLTPAGLTNITRVSDPAHPGYTPAFLPLQAVAPAAFTATATR